MDVKVDVVLLAAIACNVVCKLLLLRVGPLWIFANASVAFLLSNRWSCFPLPSRDATNSVNQIPTTWTKLLINFHNPPPTSPVLQLRDNGNGDGVGGWQTKERKKRLKPERKIEWVKELLGRKGEECNVLLYEGFHFFLCLSRIKQ